MLDKIKHLGLLAMVGCQAVAVLIGDQLELDWTQRIERSYEPWAIKKTDRGTWLRTRLCDMSRINYLHRWGKYVIAVESAPDGGGTTHVLDANKETTAENISNSVDDYT